MLDGEIYSRKSKCVPSGIKLAQKEIRMYSLSLESFLIIYYNTILPPQSSLVEVCPVLTLIIYDGFLHYCIHPWAFILYMNWSLLIFLKMDGIGFGNNILAVSLKKTSNHIIKIIKSSFLIRKRIVISLEMVGHSLTWVYII